MHHKRYCALDTSVAMLDYLHVGIYSCCRSAQPKPKEDEEQEEEGEEKEDKEENVQEDSKRVRDTGLAMFVGFP